MDVIEPSRRDDYDRLDRDNYRCGSGLDRRPGDFRWFVEFIPVLGAAAVIDLFWFFRVRVLATLIIAMSLFAGRVLAQEGRSQSPLTITAISDDLYRVRAGTAITVFLVTPEGIVLGDPLDRDTAVRLKAQLSAQFPGRPVRYVILSHLDFFRVEGATVFSDTAEVVAHQAFNAELSKARHVLPPRLAALDLNHDGRLQRSEFMGTPFEAVVAARDWNGDEQVTPEELYRLVRPAATSYAVQRIIKLGDQSVALIHPSTSRPADMTMLLFIGDRVMFAVDPPLGTTPFSVASIAMPVSDVQAWFRSTARLDFDTLLTSADQTITRSEMARHAQYVDELWRGVVDGYGAGRTVAELRDSALLAKYRGDAQFSERSRDIGYVYGTLRMMPVDLDVTGGPALLQDYADYCNPPPSQTNPALARFLPPQPTYDTCNATIREIPAATIGVGVVRRRLVARVEMRAAGQVVTSRTSALYDDSVAHRETMVSALVGYSGGLGAGLRYKAMVGWSQVFDRTATLQVFKGAFQPCCQKSTESMSSRGGLTVGADLVRPIGGRFSLVVPIRATRFFSDTYSDPITVINGSWNITTATVWPGRTNLHVGVGLAYEIARVVRP